MAKQDTEFEINSHMNGEKVSINVKGKTEMPFWEHDLKIKAAIALLNTVDFKDFANENKYDEFEKLMDELRKTVDSISSL